MILALEIILMLILVGLGGGGVIALKATYDPQKRRIQRAATDAKVAALRHEQAESDFKRSQTEINRERMETLALEKIQEIQDRATNRALNAGPGSETQYASTRDKT